MQDPHSEGPCRGPVDKTSPSNAAGLIPGWGTKIPHASRPKNKDIKQKQYCDKFNKDFKNGAHLKKKILRKKIKKVPALAVLKFSVFHQGDPEFLFHTSHKVCSHSARTCKLLSPTSHAGHIRTQQLPGTFCLGSCSAPGLNWLPGLGFPTWFQGCFDLTCFDPWDLKFEPAFLCLTLQGQTLQRLQPLFTS